MAGAFVQSATTRGSSSTASVGLTGVASGNCLVAIVSAYQGVNFSTASGGGATWNQRVEHAGTDQRIEMHVGHNTTGGSVTISMALGASYDWAIIGVELSGILTTDPFDVAASAAGSGTAPDSGATATLAQADSFKISGVCHTGANITVVPRAGDGDTEITGQENGLTGMVVVGAYQVLAATTAVSGRWTIGASNAWAAGVLVLKAAAGGGGGGDHPASKRFGGVPHMALPGRRNVWAPVFKSNMLVGPSSPVLRRAA